MLAARPMAHVACALRPLRSPSTATMGTAITASSRASNVPLRTQQPRRSLVSTVLLSRDGYESKKMAELKDELKRRGLTTSGRRDALIQRLLNDDTLRAGSHATQPEAKSRPATIVAKAGDVSTSRPNSTLASLRQPASPPPPPQPAAVGPDPSEAAVGGDAEKATISHPPNMEPGSVSSSVADPLTAGIKAPEKLVPSLNPPGVPPQKEPAATNHHFAIKIPTYEEEPIPGPEIPLMTAYFDPAHRTPPPEVVQPLKAPKVLTVSAPATYPGGGVVHHAADFGDDSLDIGGGQTSGGEGDGKAAPRGPLGELLSAFGRDLGLDAALAARSAPRAAEGGAAGVAKSILDDARSTIETVSASSSSSAAATIGGATPSATSDGGSSSHHDRPLSSDEQSGVYVLLALLAGGFALGSFGKPSKKSVEQKRLRLEAIAAQAQAVQRGDAASRLTSSSLLLQDAELAAIVLAAEEALKR